MAEAVAVLTLLALGVGVVAMRAVLDGLRVGVPASIAVLAPVAEAARSMRSRPTAPAPRLLPVVGGTVLLAASVLRVLALPVAGPALLGEPLGIGWFAAADLLWWMAGALLVRRDLRGYALRALAVELPLLLAIAAPVVAAGSVRVRGARAAEGDLPFAAEAPIALLLLLVVGGVLMSWAVAPRTAGSGAGRLLVGAGLAAQPVSVAAVASVLLLDAGGSAPGGGRLVVLTVLLTALLVVVARRFPALRPPLVARLSAAVLLPLAAVQLAVVAALTLLAAATS